MCLFAFSVSVWTNKDTQGETDRDSGRVWFISCAKYDHCSTVIPKYRGWQAKAKQVKNTAHRRVMTSHPSCARDDLQHECQDLVQGACQKRKSHYTQSHLHIPDKACLMYKIHQRPTNNSLASINTHWVFFPGRWNSALA